MPHEEMRGEVFYILINHGYIEMLSLYFSIDGYISNKTEITTEINYD